MRHPGGIALCLLLCSGCGERDETSTPLPVAPVACPPGERTLDDGSCSSAGVPPDRCAPGFESDGAGCVPILPLEPCPPGLMALPGETNCRPVAPCGSGLWGDIPVEANSQHVDGSFTGTPNGSASAPWPTIQQAIDAAASGSLVAIAPGSYAEDVELTSKSLRIWGKCPSEVEIVSTGVGPASVLIISGAHGSELHTVSLTGLGWGVSVSGAENVLLDRLWIHDNDRGLELGSLLGPTSVTVQGTLIEHATEQGIVAAGIALTITDSVIRDTQPLPAGTGGFAMSIQTDTGNGTPVLFEARNVVVERNTSLAMLLWGATANLDAMVIRDTFPQPSNGDLGRALSVEYDYLFNHRAAVTVTSSVIRNHSEFGIIAGGSDLVVDATTVGDIWPEAQSQKFGRCIQAQDESAQPPSVTITHSLLERCHDVGLNVAGGLLLTESLWIRDVLPKALDQRAGRGINIQMSSSEPLTGTATVRDSRVERSVEMGVAILDSVATVEHTLIFATAARADALFGDGIDVFTLGSPAAVQIVASRIEQGARAGVASFGAHVSLADTQIYCHGFDLNGESHAGQPHLFEDLGGNECGCGEPVDCTLDTATLQPPEPLEDAP